MSTLLTKSLGALLASLAVALPAAAVQTPLTSLFVPGHAELTAAGEQWLQAQVRQRTAKPKQLVVVTLPGAETTLQERRAQTLRLRLAALGVLPQQIYFEAGNTAR